jgi:hypothetical protein
MILVKADKNSKPACCPTRSFCPRWGSTTKSWSKPASCSPARDFNQARRARVKFSGKNRQSSTDPFSETKELVAGFWLWQCKSKEEAIERVKRCPNPMQGESEIEIRQVFENEDFGAEFTPELREQEDRIRAQIAARQ